MAKKIEIPPSGLKRIIFRPNQTHVDDEDDMPVQPFVPGKEGEAGPAKLAAGVASTEFNPLGDSPLGYAYTALPPLTGTNGLIDDNTSNNQQKTNWSAIWTYLAALFGTSGTPTEALASITSAGGIGAAGGSTTGPVTIGKGVSYVNGADLPTTLSASSVALVTKWLVSNVMQEQRYALRHTAGSDWTTAQWYNQWVIDSTVMATFAIRPTVTGPVFTWTNGNGSVVMSFDATATKTLAVPRLQVSSAADAEALVANVGANTSALLNQRSTGICGIYNYTAARWRGYFDASDNFVAFGNVTAFSDVRLKENVKVIDAEHAVRVVCALRPVSYRRKDIGEHGVGFIAQEVKELIPEVVSKGADGMLALAYGNMGAIYAAALQEAFRQINELKKEIEILKKRP